MDAVQKRQAPAATCTRGAKRVSVGIRPSMSTPRRHWVFFSHWVLVFSLGFLKVDKFEIPTFTFFGKCEFVSTNSLAGKVMRSTRQQMNFTK
jgi:hypothetical protein